MPTEAVTEVVSAAKGSSISIPTSVIFALLADGVGTVSGHISGPSVTSAEVADIVDDKIAAREEITELKLSSIGEKLDRIEGKLDKFHETP